jgi:hypothetical protein
LAIVDANPTWRIKSLQKNGCTALISKSRIPLWRKQVEEGGTRKEKYLKINQFVLENFLESRQQCKILKSKNLQQWASQKASEIKALSFFKASESWISSFKRRHRFVSRKVTHLVNRHEVIHMDQILAKADTF